MTNPHILFVDDDTKLTELLALYLEAHGFRVTTAVNATEAKRLLEETRFDLGILDVNLNGESGLELLQVMKAKSENVPVFMYTGLDVDEHLVRQTLQGRGEGVIHKTQSLDTLLTAVRRHVQPATA